MQIDTDTLGNRALQQRLDDTGYDWSAEMDRPEIDWLRWAIVRDAARLLRVLPMPAFAELHQHSRSPGIRPVIEMDPVEQHFLKLAMVVATQRLVRLPEYGPLWNSVQAQRSELRSQADALEKAGQKDAADRLRRQMPASLRRADVVERRKEKESTPAPAPMPQTPVPPPTVPEVHGGGFRP
jgi:hypothetical protein